MTPKLEIKSVHDLIANPHEAFEQLANLRKAMMEVDDILCEHGFYGKEYFWHWKNANLAAVELVRA